MINTNSPRPKLSLKKSKQRMTWLWIWTIFEKKTEALEPQRQRKAKFGPFEPSFEEEENHKEPKSLQSIQWDPFMEPFTNNPLDYFGHRDCVPAINLSRTLRKGDILELKVLAIENPESF